MIRTYARPALVPKHVPIDFRDSIEWEELPSSCQTAPPVLYTIPTPQAANPVEAANQFNNGWSNTLPADLVETPLPQPFIEPLQGLAMREMNEPELFRHFFG
jgi:hypothetical protein